jgi:hypothetical protein
MRNYNILVSNFPEGNVELKCFRFIQRNTIWSNFWWFTWELNLILSSKRGLNRVYYGFRTTATTALKLGPLFLIWGLFFLILRALFSGLNLSKGLQIKATISISLSLLTCILCVVYLLDTKPNQTIILIVYPNDPNSITTIQTEIQIKNK